jgi:hypothetical protein
MDRFGRLLWQVGDELNEAVREAFAVLGYEAELLADPASVRVTLGGRRRLLLCASSSKGVIQKKSAEVGHVFQMVHTIAEESDRVVLVTNSDPTIRPADRPDAMGPEALTLLSKLGVNILQGPALFALWMLALESKDRAMAQVERLHGQDGGAFALTTTPAARNGTRD